MVGAQFSLLNLVAAILLHTAIDILVVRSVGNGLHYVCACVYLTQARAISSFHSTMGIEDENENEKWEKQFVRKINLTPFI